LAGGGLRRSSSKIAGKASRPSNASGAAKNISWL
jgi:hypothetical protein